MSIAVNAVAVVARFSSTRLKGWHPADRGGMGQIA
jgi:hypothetical protein